MPSRRLFIGLTPDAAVRQAILDWRARWQWPAGTALSRPERLHITLFFLGEVDEARLDDLRASLSQVPTTPMQLVLTGQEVWPRGIAVLRPRPNEALAALHADMAQALIGAGFEAATERWKPHVTLARKALQAQAPPEAPAIAWRVADWQLVWSKLPPLVAQPAYEVLASGGRRG